MAVLPRLVVALSAIVLLAGCGGGSAPPTGSAAQGAPSGGRTPEQISFIIPTAASSGSSRHRNTLPSSTQSVMLAFSGPYGAALVPAVAPVTINTSTCTPVSTGLQCTTTANLPNGPASSARLRPMREPTEPARCLRSERLRSTLHLEQLPPSR